MFELYIKCYSYGRKSTHDMIWDCVDEVNNRLEGGADIDPDEVEEITITRIDEGGNL